MPVVIALLRAVNVGGHGKIKMEELRALCTSLKLRQAQTYVQSGNVVFKTDERNLAKLSERIQSEIEHRLGVRTDVFLRTPGDMRDVIARNPFAKRRGIEPSKLLVYFLTTDPGIEALVQASELKIAPEKLFPSERELYIYFPNGMGRPKLSWPVLQRILKTPGTGRNWNTVTKLMAMAEAMESAK